MWISWACGPNSRGKLTTAPPRAATAALVPGTRTYKKHACVKSQSAAQDMDRTRRSCVTPLIWALAGTGHEPTDRTAHWHAAKCLQGPLREAGQERGTVPARRPGWLHGQGTPPLLPINGEATDHARCTGRPGNPVLRSMQLTVPRARLPSGTSRFRKIASPAKGEAVPDLNPSA